MSGYLQRLAARAMQPTEAIHPVLGSVFSPQYAAEQQMCAQEENETVASSSPASYARVSRSEGLEVDEQTVTRDSRSPAAGVQIRPPDIPKTTEAARSTTVRNTSKSFEPLLPRKEEEIPTSVEPAQRRDSSRGEHAQQTVLQHVYTPLVTSEIRSPQEKPGGQPTGYVSPDRRPQTRLATGGAQASEPDEIQIHIGRIEVTAVPQTQIRPALKSARKGMSLDEYLKSRNRRA